MKEIILEELKMIQVTMCMLVHINSIAAVFNDSGYTATVEG